MDAIAIDFGYNAIWAVTASGRTLPPSAVTPYREMPPGDLAKKGCGHIVNVRPVPGNTGRTFAKASA